VYVQVRDSLVPVSSTVFVSMLPLESCVNVVRLPGSSICVGNLNVECHCVVIVRARGVP
jgi:hypothetical protein